MTPRQTKLVHAAEAVAAARRELEMDFPLSDLDNPMTSTMKRELIQSRQKDIASLGLAEKSVMALAVDPDNFGKLMDLRSKNRAAFDAIMVLVDIEIERIAAVPAKVAA